MASISCPNPFSPCFDNSSPFQNISSEAPDETVIPSCYAGYFGARSYGRPYSYIDKCGEAHLGTFFRPSPGPPTGTPGVEYPPLGSDWEQQTGGGWCISTESQTEADLCAMREGEDANSDNWPTITQDPVTGLPIRTPQEKFPNQPQTCTVECADGSPFTFTVAAGKFLAESTDVANAMAYSFACRQAQINRVCLITLSLGGGCVGQEYSGSVIAAGTATFYTMTIPSGTLPPGMTYSLSSLNESFAILFSGVLTTTGSYTFTVRAEDVHGNFMQKEFTIVVLEITTSSLPDAGSGAAYSQTIVTVGGTSPYTYALTGSLPPGLSLSSSGTISGTVTSGTAPAIYGFEVTATDSAANSCLKHFTIEVTDTCPSWASGQWTSYLFAPPGPNYVLPALLSFGLDSFSGSAVNPPTGVATIDGTLTYNGPGCSCRASITFAGSFVGIPGPNSVVTVISSTAGVLGFRNYTTYGDGTHIMDFTVADTLGSDITLTVRFSVSATDVAPGSISTNATIVNL